MSKEEKEAIKNVEKFIYSILNGISAKDCKILLDLYNKEKEKNRILEDLLQGKLYELYLYYKDLAGSYQANSISKDKIREKIEELRKKTTNVVADEINEIIINVLQELLKERK